jgi:hypothetical protein
MRSVRFALALILPAVQLASCTGSDVTTPADTPAPTFGQSSAPPTSGPNVQRGVPLAFIVGPDVETQLALEAGFDEPITAANCARPEDISFFSLTQQQVSTPAGREQFTTPSQQVEVTIFRLQSPLTDLCQLVSAPVVASGTATVVWGEKNVPRRVSSARVPASFTSPCTGS